MVEEGAGQNGLAGDNAEDQVSDEKLGQEQTADAAESPESEVGTLFGAFLGSDVESEGDSELPPGLADLMETEGMDPSQLGEIMQYVVMGKILTAQYLPVASVLTKAFGPELQAIFKMLAEMAVPIAEGVNPSNLKLVEMKANNRFAYLGYLKTAGFSEDQAMAILLAEISPNASQSMAVSQLCSSFGKLTGDLMESIQKDRSLQSENLDELSKIFDRITNLMDEMYRSKS